MAQISIPDGSCATINCRGMLLLGFACTGTVYFCVHQLSAELWKLYDTPRVSVQKKIVDLHIQLLNCNKEQIRLLRMAGIIENFRATMIEIRDTERLFDALEHSRRKRGLFKHPLKVNSGPSERALRAEEKRAKRLEMRARPLVSQGEGLRLENHAAAGCALDRITTGLRTLQSQKENEPSLARGAEAPSGVLLVVEDAVEVQDIASEISIEVNVNLAGETGLHPNCVPVQRMEHSHSVTHPLDPLLGSSNTLQLNTGHRYANVLESPRLSPECFSDASFVFSPRPISQLYRHTSRLSSPAFEFSEPEERSSVYSYSKSSSASPRQLSTTPERFLLLDSDLESDVSENSEVLLDSSSVGQKGVQNHTLKLSTNTKPVDRELPLHYNTINSQGGKVGRPYRKPTATKLRHFAKATSPDSAYRQLLLSTKHQKESTSKPSLIVSIPLSMLRQSNKHTVVHKPRRVTLSSFVTKKRASSRTPSTSSDSSYEPPGIKRTKSTATRGQGNGRSNSRGGKCVGAKATAARPRRTCSASEVMGVGVEPLTTAPSLKGASAADLERSNSVLLEGSKISASLNFTVNGKLSVLQAHSHMHRGSLDNGSTSLQEDDQLSIASASTNSTTNSINGRVRSRSTSRARKDVTTPKPTFSFEELFSFYPPKLVLIDDELQPEQSLSVKDYDRHALPESHPFWKWTFGQPVKGMTTMKKKRKVMVNGNGSSSSARD